MLWTAQARRDVEEIAYYLASRNRYALARYDELFQRAIGLLDDQPAIGRDRSELRPGIRSWPVPPYVMFYRVTPTEPELVRVLHMSRLVVAELFK
ncbi:MAG: type II toxin-antitoxin system RelE/ParE family toxin [Hyphomicrobium sp.]|nr:type II toxin-antitoxin system RelE/ParE family toxin [Hyphomicrobium sp.]